MQTLSALKPQDKESRFRNIVVEICDELDKQHDLRLLSEDQRFNPSRVNALIDGLSIAHPRDAIARIVERCFSNFITANEAVRIADRSVTINDIVILINEKVGPTDDHDTSYSDIEIDTQARPLIDAASGS